MREFLSNNYKKIVQRWGKAVHNICTSCAQSGRLSTRVFAWSSSHVHKPRDFATVYTRLVPLFIPAVFRVFLSVTRLVMPTIHTTYKENNKSKILNSYFLYT